MKDVVTILLCCVVLIGALVGAVWVGAQLERGRLYELYTTLERGAQVNEAIGQVSQAWERDLRACHQQLTRVQLARTPSPAGRGTR